MCHYRITIRHGVCSVIQSLHQNGDLFLCIIDRISIRHRNCKASIDSGIGFVILITNRIAVMIGGNDFCLGIFREILQPQLRAVPVLHDNLFIVFADGNTRHLTHGKIGNSLSLHALYLEREIG